MSDFGVGPGANQAAVASWCAAAFGVEHASSVPQRGIRLAEEAIEAAQAAGCSAEMVHRLVDYVFSRPRGDLAQEIGGVAVTMLALANAAGLSAADEEDREINRILGIPLEHFAKRAAEKAAAGIAAELGDEPPEDLVISNPLALGVTRANESTDGTQVEPIMQFFAFDHLPPALRAASEPFAMLARRVVASTPRNAERSVALRKLLEAKDAAVRAAMFKP